jgi:beta-glucosidase/6-phospho-beta-glucosidase/beta-galactosidase
MIKPPPLYFQVPASCFKFPRNFIFGTASSAGQIEGATADQGKSPSFLDVLANVLEIAGKNAIGGGVLGTPEGEIVSNAVTAENYYLYKRDIDRLAAVGIKYYSFSLAWTRILPFTFPGTPVNSYGIQHYSDVIDYILSKGMIPIVTITHFDTPLALYGGGKGYLAPVAAAAMNSSYGLGGVTFEYSNSQFEEAYVNYAKIALSHFADRVPIWITFNEPQIGSANATAVTNVLRSHARVYRYYRDVLKGKGKFSIKMGITPAVPLDGANSTDVEAAKFFSDLYTFPYLYPTVFGKQYPENFLKALPGAKPLTSDELKLINGTMGKFPRCYSIACISLWL